MSIPTPTDRPVFLAGRELLRIVHEDDRLLVLNKPAGLVCHPTKTDEWSSLVARVRLYLGPGSAARLVNRLDRETSGLVLAGKTVEAAGALGKLWESRAVRKTYLAIVRGTVAEEAGVVDAPLGKDDASVVAIKDCVRTDGAPARTEFKVLRRFHRTEGDFTLLQVVPLTGRKHQIRLHLAHVGHPIVGDKIYGGDEQLYLALVEGRLGAEGRSRLLLPYQALHAGKVEFDWAGQPWDFRADPEPWFNDFVDGKVSPG
jgi:23S rRNA pseudouridine1911/1915/1917 synthase